jgi:hypothetical protein
MQVFQRMKLRLPRKAQAMVEKHVAERRHFFDVREAGAVRGHELASEQIR